ncbi:Fungal specific transcription factor domain-containing protein [Debaryomyces fabryi]|uniref:Fungal specific transcription factor domain-containing protein n=1 Tax=Debaryomyces fabryi TaxID=58627 RepID=A0A0V1PQ95_9ASCO|nr:Fungal specific transcription factor domain-containing protein [Debaryomyces fabryi]KRZ98413.1 Fungal specific transcription factor domain-containing protein [Debaryomyces fabryi]
MSMAICLCISSKIDDETSGLNISPASSCSANTPVSIQSMNNDQLTMLQDELFDNCIFYYHRILVISDGIETIQAFILLIIYIESSYITSHVSYILISLAIRFAQEIGLHRQETYTNLSPQECETRKMVWWCCYCFDMEICFRSGKPPLINGLDINVNSEMDFFFGNVAGKEKVSNGEKFEALDPRKHFSSYMQYYFLLLTRIRSKSYTSLFVASAQTESFENLLLTLESLNMEILKLGDKMNPVMRPRFYDDPEFHKAYQKFDSIDMKNILIVNFVYFSNLMIINRIPFLTGIPDDDETRERCLSFRNLYLKSARTILLMANNIPREYLGLSFFNWAVFYPSSAFMSLLASCINHPTEPGTYDDIRLLIDSSMNFFSHKRSWPVEGFSKFKVYQSKDALVDLIVRILLRIVIRVFETKTGVPILANNDALRQHLESTEKQFPDIFKESKDFCSHFASVLNASFGNQGCIKIVNYSPFTSCKSPNKSPDLSSSSHQNNSFNLQNNNGIRRNDSNSYDGNMNPNFLQALDNASTNDNPINHGLLSDYMNDEDFSSIKNSQMNNLPNFFFDNNLGL